MVGVEEEVLDAVQGDDQPRDEGAAQLQVADEPLLGDPRQGAAKEEVVESGKTNRWDVVWFRFLQPIDSQMWQPTISLLHKHDAVGWSGININALSFDEWQIVSSRSR